MDRTCYVFTVSRDGKFSNLLRNDSTGGGGGGGAAGGCSPPRFLYLTYKNF